MAHGARSKCGSGPAVNASPNATSHSRPRAGQRARNPQFPHRNAPPKWAPCAGRHTVLFYALTPRIWGLGREGHRIDSPTCRSSSRCRHLRSSGEQKNSGARACGVLNSVDDARKRGHSEAASDSSVSYKTRASAQAAPRCVRRRADQVRLPDDLHARRPPPADGAQRARSSGSRP